MCIATSLSSIIPCTQSATWEWAEDVADDRVIGRFQRFQRPPSLTAPHPALLSDVRPPADQWKPYAESPKYLNGRTLRPYQLEGLNWLVFSWYQVRLELLPLDSAHVHALSTVWLLPFVDAGLQ